MDPVHIFFNKLEIDKNNTYTANISKENKVENVLFNTDKEYVVTEMIIIKTTYRRFRASENLKY